MIRRICLDMDGVLCDFVGGTARLLGFDPSVVTQWDYYEQAGTTEDAFWRAIDAAGEQFWAHLDIYHWAKSLYEMCENLAPTVILTSPSTHGSSFVGKIDWLKWHLGSQFRNYLMGGCKEFCASTGVVLIDDSDKNCQKFEKEGGRAILFPRPWNENRDISNDPFSYVRGQLDYLNA